MVRRNSSKSRKNPNVVASRWQRNVCLGHPSRTVEFEKGKTAIAVPSFDQLPRVIDTLITAVRNDELDNQIGAASTKPQKKAAKK
jgi:hypothetical protein